MKTEIKRRNFDGKYVLWGYTVDPTYRPEKINENNIPYIPQRWVMLGVYHEKQQAFEKQKELSSN